MIITSTSLKHCNIKRVQNKTVQFENTARLSCTTTASVTGTNATVASTLSKNWTLK